MAEEIDLTDVLDAHRDAIKGELWTTLPGEVVLYEASKQTAHVRCPVATPIWNPDTEEYDYEEMTMFSKVPVLFPGGQAFAVTWPLQPGDSGVLVFPALSIQEYLAGITESKAPIPAQGPQDPTIAGLPKFTPVTAQRLSNKSCLFIPANIPGVTLGGAKAPAVNADPATTAGDRMVIGAPGSVQVQVTETSIILGAGATDAPALASKVDAVLSAINGWTPVPNDGGAALKTALAGLLGSTKSALVKCK